MDYKIIAERMWKIKKEKGIYFRYIEEVTGISNCRLMRMLQGRTVPNLSEFALLCIALGASADELLKPECIDS